MIFICIKAYYISYEEGDLWNSLKFELLVIILYPKILVKFSFTHPLQMREKGWIAIDLYMY